jgi:glycosyltransferase involved in cell wall biosynthesis
MAPYGGIERHVCSLAAELAQKGHQVTFLTTSNSLGAELRKELDRPGIRFVELGIGRGHASKGQKLLWLVFRSLKARFTRWDVIYTNGQSALARYVWWAAGPGTRIIHHHHTSAALDEQQGWSPAFKKVLRDAPEVFACSNFTRRCIDAAVGRSDTRFLPYLTACPITAAEVHEVTPRSPLHFGFLGRLIPEKGIGRIMQLSQDPRLSHIEWHIHGSGPDYPAESFAAYPNIRYHGPYRAPAEHAEALRGLDALVLFSTHNEGMPLCLIEAMSAGLPWIATDRGGTAELARSQNESRILPETATFEDMVQACLDLSENLQAGRCSRLRQRAIYDDFVSPSSVIRQWFNALGA